MGGPAGRPLGFSAAAAPPSASATPPLADEPPRSRGSSSSSGGSSSSRESARSSSHHCRKRQRLAPQPTHSAESAGAALKLPHLQTASCTCMLPSGTGTLLLLQGVVICLGPCHCALMLCRGSASHPQSCGVSGHTTASPSWPRPGIARCPAPPVQRWLPLAAGIRDLPSAHQPQHAGLQPGPRAVPSRALTARNGAAGRRQLVPCQWPWRSRRRRRQRRRQRCSAAAVPRQLLNDDDAIYSLLLLIYNGATSPWYRPSHNCLDPPSRKCEIFLLCVH